MLSPTAAIGLRGAIREARGDGGRTLSQISSADCSTHPGCGWLWPTGAEPRARMDPSAPTSTAFVALVP